MTIHSRLLWSRILMLNDTKIRTLKLTLGVCLLLWKCDPKAAKQKKHPVF
jgi:hypothetical protein